MGSTSRALASLRIVRKWGSRLSSSMLTTVNVDVRALVVTTLERFAKRLSLFAKRAFQHAALGFARQLLSTSP